MAKEVSRVDIPRDQLEQWLEVEAQFILQNAGSVAENRFQIWVGKYAWCNGWLYYHTEKLFRSPSGYPDCHFVRAPESFYAELKSLKPGAKVSPKQLEWLEALRACRYEVHVWYPTDIPQIRERLRRRF